jgi:hypothetical protein
MILDEAHEKGKDASYEEIYKLADKFCKHWNCNICHPDEELEPLKDIRPVNPFFLLLLNG